MASLQFSPKKPVVGLLLASLAVLTACGGGGSGGGGGGKLTNSVKVDFPADSSTLTDSSADFEVDFTSAAVNTSGLEITLNGYNVTPLFSPSTGAVSRKASVYSLSGMLVEGENYFNAKVAGSTVAGVKFNYDAKPEVILTALTPGAGLGEVNINGLTRKTAFDQVKLFDGSNTDLGDAQLLAVNTVANRGFSFQNQTLPAPGTAVAATADYKILASDVAGSTADDLATNLIVPRATLKYGAAMQVNNSTFASGSVVAGWVSQIITPELETAFDEFEGTPDYATATGYDDTGLDPLLDSFSDSTACQIINIVESAGAKSSNCKLFVSNIEPVGTASPQIQVLNSATNIADNQFRLQVKVTFPQLKLTLHNVSFTPSAGDYQGHLITTWTYQNVSFAFKVDVKRDITNAESLPTIIGISSTLPANPYELDMGASATAADSLCVSRCAGALPATLNTNLTTLAGDAIPTLENAVVAELGTLTGEIEAELANAYITNKAYYTLIKDVADTALSALNFNLSGSVVNEARTSASNCTAVGAVCSGAFIGIGGSTYADNNNALYQETQAAPAMPELLPAVGSYFAPVANTSKVAGNFFNASDNVTLALSSNSLNQLLLAVYQSKMLAARQLELSFADLGMPDPAIPYRPLKADDLVTIDLNLKAVPSASFATGGNAELRLNALEVAVTLYWSCTDTGDGKMTAAECKKLYTSTFELDAKMQMKFGLNAGLPEATVNDTAIHIAGDVINTFIDEIKVTDTPLFAGFNNEIKVAVNKQLSAGGVAVLMTTVLKDYVTDQTASLLSPIQCDVGVSGYTLDDAWLVFNTLTSENDFLVFAATLAKDTSPAPQGMVKLNLYDPALEPSLEDGCQPL